MTETAQTVKMTRRGVTKRNMLAEPYKTLHEVYKMMLRRLFYDQVRPAMLSTNQINGQNARHYWDAGCFYANHLPSIYPPFTISLISRPGGESSRGNFEVTSLAMPLYAEM